MTCIVQLEGGLGNQLFQLAFARSLAIKNGNPTILDDISTNFTPTRGRIAILRSDDLMYKIASFEKVRIYKRSNRAFILENNKRHNINSLWDRRSGFHMLRIYQENYRQFVYDFLFKSEGFFSGTFACHLYWRDGDRKDLIDWIANHIEQYLGSDVPQKETGIGIHARRGDYVTNPKTRKFHGYCDTNYFTRSLELLADQGYTRKGIVIGSDDASFAQELFQTAKKYSKHVTFASSSNPYLAMLQLASTESTIGSNSTFSFWMSYLKSKHVRIFPKTWFADKHFDFDPTLTLFSDAILLDNELNS